MLKPVRRAKGKQIREQTKGVKVKFVGYLAHEAGCQEEEDLGIPLAITVWHGKRIVRDGNKQGEKKESRDGEKRKKKNQIPRTHLRSPQAWAGDLLERLVGSAWRCRACCLRRTFVADGVVVAAAVAAAALAGGDLSLPQPGTRAGAPGSRRQGQQQRQRRRRRRDSRAQPASSAAPPSRGCGPRAPRAPTSAS